MQTDTGIPVWQHEVVNIIREKYPELEGIYIYGSQARGTANEQSDIDVCVMMPETSTVSRYDFNINYVLTKKTGKPVSVVFATIHNQWCEKLIYSRT